MPRVQSTSATCGLHLSGSTLTKNYTVVMIQKTLLDEHGAQVRLVRQLPSFNVRISVEAADGTMASFLASAADMRSLSEMLAESADAADRLGS